MTRRRKKHRPDEIVAKLRDADAMLSTAVSLQPWGYSFPPRKRVEKCQPAKLSE